MILEYYTLHLTLMGEESAYCNYWNSQKIQNYKQEVLNKEWPVT